MTARLAQPSSKDAKGRLAGFYIAFPARAGPDTFIIGYGRRADGCAKWQLSMQMARSTSAAL